MARKNWPNYVQNTGARFETREVFARKSAVVDSTADYVMTAGVPMTRLSGNEYACTARELHTFVIGDSGCGKTRRCIVPTIRMIAKSGESMIIADPKGELYKKTAVALKNKGYATKVINFRNPARGIRWNPLKRIEELYLTGEQASQDKAALMLKDLTDIMKSEVAKKDDAFWENVGGKFILGVAMLIMEHGEEGDLTFENISNLMDEIYEKSEGSAMEYYFSTLPEGSPIIENLKPTVTAPDKTKASIYSVAKTMVNVFTSQEAFSDLFRTNEIDIDSIGKEKTAVFIVLPDDSAALYAIATVFVKQVYSSLVELADGQMNGELPNNTVFILDEFANFARLDHVDTMLTAARSRGMRFILVCQSMEQLEEKYGSSGAEILLSNCRVWIYMSCRNYNFLYRLQNLMGERISPYTKQSTPLMSVSELQHLGIEGEYAKVLVLNDRCYPMIGYLPDYSKYDFGEGDCPVCDLPEARTSLPKKTKSFRTLTDNSETLTKRKAAAKAKAASSSGSVEDLIESIKGAVSDN